MSAEHVPNAYLPLSNCESISDVPGASSVSSVCTVKAQSGVEVVMIGSTDGFVYFVYGSAPRRGHDDSILWRRLATREAPQAAAVPPHDSVTTAPQLHGEASALDDCTAAPHSVVPYHYKIQSMCAFLCRDEALDNASFASSSGSHATMDEALVLVAVSVQCGPTKVSAFLHVYIARSLREALYPKSGPVHVGGVPTVQCAEWRRMKLPDAHLPLRLFHHHRFTVHTAPTSATMADQHPTMQRNGVDQVVLSAVIPDGAAPQLVAPALAVLVLPRSGIAGPTPPSLHWVPHTTAGSQEQPADPVLHKSLAWAIARALRQFALAPISAVTVLAAPSAWMMDAPVTVVYGCVDGAIGVLEVTPPPSNTNNGSMSSSFPLEAAASLASLRASGPIGDCFLFHPRTELHFQRPNALLDCLEDVHHVVDRSPATIVAQRVMVLDSSGKIIVLILERCGGQVHVRTSLLPDYVAIAEAKLVAAPAETTTGDAAASGVSKKPPLASKRSTFSGAFPDIAMGIQNRLMAVSAFFRSQNSQNQQAVEQRHSSTAPVPGHHDAGERVRAPLAGSSSTMSASPGGSLALDFLTNTVGTRGSEELGALLGVGPIAISECDVDGDGWNELVITTMGRLVAMYRYDAKTGQFVCVEAAEAPTHMYFCKQARLWEHSAVPAWVICGPSHLLVQCASHLRDTIMARARLLERCVAPSTHGGVDT